MEPDIFGQRVAIVDACAYTDRSLFGRLPTSEHRFLSQCSCFRDYQVGTEKGLQVNEESLERKV